MSIYITGDTHTPIDTHKLNTKNFPIQKELTKKDYVVICGDFGAVWNGSKSDEYWLKWYNTRNFTTLFIDGNHENFDLLNEYPIIEKFGGRVHRIKENVFHLMRGEVYEIDGKSFFVMGGAESHDKEDRKEGISWWSGELPDIKDYKNAIDCLNENDFMVDFILSHSLPSEIQKKLFPDYPINELTDFLQQIKETVKYEKWFTGHYHTDKTVDNCFLVYNNIIKL